MAEPLLLSRNWVDEDCVITITEPDASKSYIFDRDRASVWESVGKADDSLPIDVFIEFFEDGISVERTVDRIILLNNNFSNWTLSYWDGAAYVQATGNGTEPDDDTMNTFTPFTSTKVRLTCSSTKVADQEKSVGEVILCELLFAPADDMEANYEERFRELSVENVMGDGSIHKMVTRWAQNRVQRYEASVQFKFLSEADRATLKAIRETGDPFLWYPESAARPGEIYYVHWSNPWTARYSASYKNAGSDVSMSLREV